MKEVRFQIGKFYELKTVELLLQDTHIRMNGYSIYKKRDTDDENRYFFKCFHNGIYWLRKIGYKENYLNESDSGH